MFRNVIFLQKCTAEKIKTVVADKLEFQSTDTPF